MTTATLQPLSRPGVLADRIPGSALLRDVLLVAGGAGLTGLVAQVSLQTPLSPVPFTLQTLAVLLTGAALGTVRGAASMLLYLAAGAAGVPWFAGHAHGAGGPAFGYIVGFILAAALVGELARRGNDRSIVGTIGLMALGNAVIYLVGATWLAMAMNLGPAQAVAQGVTPFLVTDALKMAVAAGLLPLAWKGVTRTGR
ncbi:biotin transporter BioY [Streptomyces sp. TRM68367]|uniref:biotin transporter BioY n=1 Tax=Streptomyces sp. TRM68367 TaxID=2758415 RepID=UPI00165C1C65|nr:biotin transporter BioY [Streptomyces sp. TRM68367]MBC9731063.1 biotin transporter BioY [Streptomyces sp. TRM68367]